MRCVVSETSLNALPAKKSSPLTKKEELPVSVKKDLIKELYGSIAERIFGFDPSYIRWMHQTIDNVMSDRDVEREWEFIRKGNVEKLLKLMQQIQMQAGEEDAPELEQLEQLWNEVAEGIIKTKEANQEIDDTTWDFVEKNLMEFVDKFSNKLEKKALPGTEKKLLKSAVSAKLLSKKIKSAGQVDVEELEKLTKEMRSMSRKLGNLLKRANNYVHVATNLHLMPSDLMLFSYEVEKSKNQLANELASKTQSSEIVYSDSIKELEKEASGWELTLDPIYDPKLDTIVGYELNTFSDASVGLQGFNLGDFSVEGFKPTKEFNEFVKEMDSEDQNAFESFIQTLELKIKKII